jgi:hypothetical protein
MRIDKEAKKELFNLVKEKRYGSLTNLIRCLIEDFIKSNKKKLKKNDDRN